MTAKTRSTAQADAARANGSRSRGPRTPEGRMRSSLNRTVFGLSSVRLLLPTEDVEEYRAHLIEWTQSLSPRSPAEHQLVQLIADLAWRLRRLERIAQRRAAAVLEDMVEATPEWRTKVCAEDAVLGLDTVVRMVDSTPVPAPTTLMTGFVAGARGVEHLLELFRQSLAPERWPEDGACAFLGAVQRLADEVDSEEAVTVTFTSVGVSAGALAGAIRSLVPELEAGVVKARAAIASHTLLADSSDKAFERHRRLLEGSMGRQLDVLAKVKTMALAAGASGSFEQPPPVELRVVTT